MATRQVKTPGAKPEETKTTDVDQTPVGANESDPNGENVSAESSTENQAEEALQHIVSGTDQQTESLPDPRIDEILEGQKRLEKKLDQLLKASGLELKKKTRWVQGKNGLEQKEI